MLINKETSIRKIITSGNPEMETTVKCRYTKNKSTYERNQQDLNRQQRTRETINQELNLNQQRTTQNRSMNRSGGRRRNT